MRCYFMMLFMFAFSEKFDEEVVQDGVKIFIDKKAQLSLLGKYKL